MPNVTIPHHFTPRPYQLPILRALDAGVTRAVAVWHRRSGKEKTFVNFTAKRACQRIGTYFYLFPNYTQAKKAVWDGRDREGFPFLGHFPAAILAGKNESEMKLTLTNGSIIQFVGSDNIDSLMSTNPIGVVFAEYALQDPRAWDYIRPILRENGGWAVFDYTPRGKNHGYELFNLASKLVEDGDPSWFVERLTIEDTGVLSAADIEAERREGMDEELVQPEYFCSFEGAQQGSYYGRAMNQAEVEGRICRVPYQAEIAVETWWDLGIDDATAIWFTQTVGREIHVIDYYEQSGEGLPHYAKVLQERAYVYGQHHAPHDIKVRELGSGKSRLETAAGLGIKFEIVPSIGLADGIEAARAFIPRCWFDREKTERGRLSLVSYHKTYDEKRRCFSMQPYHDWSEHGASAYRYLAVGHKLQRPRYQPLPERPRSIEASGDASRAWMAI
jgi:phage terminase large subunit